MILDVFTIVFLIGGVGFILIGALGALRFQDALTRMAAVSKASTLGLTLLTLGFIFQSTNSSDTIKAILTIVILWLTTPVAAHLLGRASLLTNEKLIKKTQNVHLVEDLKKSKPRP